MNTVESMCTSIQSLKDQLNELAGKCDQLASPSSSSREPATRNVNQDRSCNIVLSGIPECRDINMWRSHVLKVLNVTAGRELALADAFRLGRYNACLLYTSDAADE